MDSLPGLALYNENRSSQNKKQWKKSKSVKSQFLKYFVQMKKQKPNSHGEQMNLTLVSMQMCIK